jgi:putative hemolysin
LDPDGSTGIWRLILLGFCLVASAFFAAFETSILTVGKIRVRNLVDEGVKNAKLLSSLLFEPDKALSAILIANNLFNILASAIATSLVIDFIGGNTGLALGLATGAITLAILIFCEITPKTFAVRKAERVAIFLTKPMFAVMVVLKPLIFLLNKLTSIIVLMLVGREKETPPTFTEDELKTMVTVSLEEGVLDDEEKEMLHNVFEFGDGEIREIMTPRIHVVSVDLDADYQTVKAAYEEHSFSRMPVTKPGTDEIVGVLNIKDVAFLDGGAEGFSISKYIRPANFIYEFNNIAKVFREMRRERIRMSVVLDEYGVMAGVVTIADFL